LTSLSSSLAASSAAAAAARSARDSTDEAFARHAALKGSGEDDSGSTDLDVALGPAGGFKKKTARPTVLTVKPPPHKVMLVDLAKPIGLSFTRDMRVTKVHPAGQAEGVGIMKGAIVVAVAGVRIRNVVDFQLEMRRCQFAGDEHCEVREATLCAYLGGRKCLRCPPHIHTPHPSCDWFSSCQRAHTPLQARY
jgi:hypothetical protein